MGSCGECLLMDLLRQNAYLPIKGMYSMHNGLLLAIRSYFLAPEPHIPSLGCGVDIKKPYSGSLQHFQMIFNPNGLPTNAPSPSCVCLGKPMRSFQSWNADISLGRSKSLIWKVESLAYYGKRLLL